MGENLLQSSLHCPRGKHFQEQQQQLPLAQLQQSTAEFEVLSRFFSTDDLETLDCEEQHRLYLRLIDNPLQLHLNEFLGLSCIGYESYCQALVYCPSRYRFDEESCEMARQMIGRVNELYRDGYIARQTDFVFENPAQSNIQYDLLREVGFRGTDKHDQLIWDYRQRCRDGLLRRLRFTAERELEHVFPTDELSEFLKAGGVRVIGLARADGVSLSSLEESVPRHCLEALAKYRTLVVEVNSIRAWPDTQRAFSRSEAVILKNVEYISVYNLIQLLDTLAYLGPKVVVLQCNLEAGTETSELISGVELHRVSPQPIFGVNGYYPEFRADVGLANLCYRDERAYTKGLCIERLRDLKELNRGHPVCWIETSALREVVRLYLGSMSPRSSRVSCQFVANNLADLELVTEKLQEVSEAMLYPGIRIKLSNSHSLPEDQRFEDPFQTQLVCHKLYASPDYSDVVVGFSTMDRRLEDEPELDSLASCQIIPQDCMLLEQLCRTNNYLLIYYSSDPVQFRHLRRLCDQAVAQVLIVADAKNMRALKDV